MIELEAGEMHLEVLPEVGGALANLTWNARAIVRHTPSGVTNPFDTGSFPLVPFTNRIALGKFRFGGRDVLLGPNRRGDIHPLHGQGYRAPWTVAEMSKSRAILRFSHPVGEWPWSYDAEEIYSLENSRLRIDLSVRNTSDTPMPAGIGFHPYFPRPADTIFQMDFDGVWLVDETLIPTRQLPVPGLTDWRKPIRVSDGAPTDHCHYGWRSPAFITYPSDGLKLTLSASDIFRWFQLYIPEGQNFFCAEPASHMPDPFNQPVLEDTGMKVLAPGETLSGWMAIDVATL
ncbi:MAG TPA: aldose 1-epimerase [Rhizomicrobium sp.]